MIFTTVSVEKFNKAKISLSYSNNILKIIKVLISECLKNENKKNNDSIFVSTQEEINSISLPNLFFRLCRYGTDHNRVFVILLILIDRYKVMSNDVLRVCNIHKLIAASFIVACKIYDDNCYSNRYYSSVVGIKNSLLNDLERNFLISIQWNTIINKNIYNKYTEVLNSIIT